MPLTSTIVYVPGMPVRRSAVRRPSGSCAALLPESVAPADAEDLARTLQALADPTRLRLLAFVAAQPGGEACVCHLTAPVGLTQPTVSHHLRLLHEAGFLGREKRGAWVFYRILPGRLRDLREELSAIGSAGPVVRATRRSRKAS